MSPSDTKCRDAIGSCNLLLLLRLKDWGKEDFTGTVKCPLPWPFDVNDERSGNDCEI